MRIPGVPDDQLAWIHWNYGNGRDAMACRHEPSGTVVPREYPPNLPIQDIAQALIAELREKLTEKASWLLTIGETVMPCRQGEQLKRRSAVSAKPVLEGASFNL